MVALCVRSLDQRPVRCSARTLLYAAHTSLEQGFYIEAGCQLREAVRRFLLAECVYYDCMPKPACRKSPIALAASLRAAGQVSDDCHSWLVEMIEICDKAANLVFIRPSIIANAIKVAHVFLDGSPYLIEAAAEGGRR